MLILIGPEPVVGMGRHEFGREVQRHVLAGEARRREEGAQPLPASGPVAGLLLEFAPSREIGILDRAGCLVGDIESPGRDLEEDPRRGRPPLADEQDAVVGVERQDRDRAGVAGDVAFGAGPVGALDRVDPELEVATAMEDA